MSRFLRSQSSRLMAGLLGLVLAAGAIVATTQPADARVFFSVGIGFPIVPVYPPYPYYYPPAYYYPPPAYYYPPPVVYAPPPQAQAPVAVNPVGDAYTAPNGQTCREYQSTVVVNGQQQPSYGTACLQPDGSWRITN